MRKGNSEWTPFPFQIAGRKLQECIASNQALIYLDLRFTGIPQVSEFTLQQTVEANDNRLRLATEREHEVMRRMRLILIG